MINPHYHLVKCCGGEKLNALVKFFGTSGTRQGGEDVPHQPGGGVINDNIIVIIVIVIIVIIIIIIINISR